MEWKTVKFKMKKISLKRTKLYRFWRWITFRPIKKLNGVYSQQMYQDLKKVNNLKINEELLKLFQYEFDMQVIEKMKNNS